MTDRAARRARRVGTAARAALALAAAALASGAWAAPIPLKELTWFSGVRTRFLRVGPPAAGAPLQGLELPPRRARRGEEPPASQRHLLLSVVGPMVSRYGRVAAADGSVTEHLETEWLDGFTFDLRSYLARNARLPPGLEAADLARFAVVDWDGKDVLTLEVERSGCERSRPGCTLQTARVVTPPPSGWRPWLEASLRGRGFLLRGAAAWWGTLSADELAQARAELAQQPTPRARREWIAREVNGRQRAPVTAAWLAEESFPLERFATDLETQWAAADRLLYLASFDVLAQPAVPSCARPALDALSRRAWATAPARAALANAVLCLRGGPRPPAPDALERLRERCAGAAAPMACARPELAPLLEEKLRGAAR